MITDRDSLSVRISPKGKIVFQYRYRFNSEGKRLDLGTYPLIGLKDARVLALKYKAELDQGKDPMQLKLKYDTDYLDQLTVKEICDLQQLHSIKYPVKMSIGHLSCMLHLDLTQFQLKTKQLL